MVRQLRSWGEYGAADWFQKLWCGERGTRTMGDAGIGHTAHKNGVEGNLAAFYAGGLRFSWKIKTFTTRCVCQQHDQVH